MLLDVPATTIEMNGYRACAAAVAQSKRAHPIYRRPTDPAGATTRKTGTQAPGGTTSRKTGPQAPVGATSRKTGTYASRMARYEIKAVQSDIKWAL